MLKTSNNREEMIKSGKREGERGIEGLE